MGSSTEMVAVHFHKGSSSPHRYCEHDTPDQRTVMVLDGWSLAQGLGDSQIIHPSLLGKGCQLEAIASSLHP
jgi:hypothetical protein